MIRNRTMMTASAALLAALVLSGCGYTRGERTVSGAAIGAGVGAAGAAVLGANPVTGAAIGAGAGAITGANTPRDRRYDDGY